LNKNVCDNIGDDEGVECKQLLWGKEHALQFIDQHQEKMDVIIGSDLLYVASVIQPLFETVLVLLKPKSGKFLMAHCCRRVGNEATLDMALEVARELGFERKEELRNKDEFFSVWIAE
jgi:hypothetical protein